MPIRIGVMIRIMVRVRVGIRVMGGGGRLAVDLNRGVETKSHDEDAQP